MITCLQSAMYLLTFDMQRKLLIFCIITKAKFSAQNYYVKTT